MIKILANDGIEADGLELLLDAGFEVDTDNIPQAELLTRLQAYDAILVRSATKVRKELIDACPNLKVIGRGGVGLDNIDVDYARSKGIKVVSTPAASSRSVAELVFAHIFSLSRFLHLSNREMLTSDANLFKTLKKNYAQGVELRGKTLGIIGFGRIGQEAAQIALGIGMKVVVTDVYQVKDFELRMLQNEDIRVTQKISGSTLEQVLAKSDFITVHVPFNGQAVIGKEELMKMKQGSYLIHASRGGVIDEQALLEVLEAGHLAGVGLDVFENEPTPLAALLNHPKVSVSPHIGASTMDAQVQIGRELADRLIEILAD
jgi:D-3-phosphoglycerate dehydrogenase / 2-oxoglutarate reductase